MPSTLRSSNYPKYPRPYPSLETMRHIWTVLGWEYNLQPNGVWELVTPDGHGYLIADNLYAPAHESAWETFLDVSPHYEKTSLVAQQS